MKLALLEMKVSFECEEENLSRCRRALGSAARLGADFALLPEMSLTGFTMQPKKTGQINERCVEAFSDLARDLFMNIGVGYIKKANNEYFNNYVIIDKHGHVLGEYSKIHPFSYAGEDKIYSPGTEIISLSVEGFKVGPTICYDLRFPELYQAVSQNSGLITVAASWPKARSEHWDILLKARAVENQCYIAGVNISECTDGYEYSGGSAIIDPYGHVVSQSAEKGQYWEIFMADISMEDIYKYELSFPVKKDRKPSLYVKLLK